MNDVAQQTQRGPRRRVVWRACQSKRILVQLRQVRREHSRWQATVMSSRDQMKNNKDNTNSHKRRRASPKKVERRVRPHCAKLWPTLRRAGRKRTVLKDECQQGESQPPHTPTHQPNLVCWRELLQKHTAQQGQAGLRSKRDLGEQLHDRGQIG